MDGILQGLAWLLRGNALEGFRFRLQGLLYRIMYKCRPSKLYFHNYTLLCFLKTARTCGLKIQGLHSHRIA